MKVLVGSTNPGKLKGVEDSFKPYFENVEVIGAKVPSDVKDQPVNEETYIGARNRVDNLIKYAKENNIDAHFFVGVESGIVQLFGKWMIIEVAVVKDKNGKESVGCSSATPVPEKLVQPIIDKTMYRVMVDDLKASFTSEQSGTGFLTRNVITRIDLTKESIVMALTQFINECWQ